MYEVVHDIAAQLKISYLVVGASARDLVMYHGFGAKIERATADADFGIEVPNWKTFDAFRKALLKKGFIETRHPHRLLSPQQIPIDIVPFGEIADSDANITWPPDNSFKMQVLGFQEACDDSLNVCIQENPELNIFVATPAGLALMKLIAWKDREADKRKKDANDLHYLLRNYEKIPVISDHLYSDQKIAEYYGWDMEMAGAHQLGVDTTLIADRVTAAVVEHVLTSNFEDLVQDISDSTGRAEPLLSAFKNGFLVQ